ncbi:sensor histidine kinase [Paenibacillus physcomitrellae]|uniref:histidine kinase n=1 Tax=Paenibacillus physcomitrellae TaxID=1619311 RepID=A0ABQ1FKI0_9BACL|nr:HAMP domain-containing sensor histidine kinase [Paenibacillus physcomitrellae]GGA19487.1 two-component sensor histidine kinase [Paenibacillus physcomitrellae]
MDTKWKNSLLMLVWVVLITLSASTLFQVAQTRSTYFKKNYFYTAEYANQVQQLINYVNQMDFNELPADQDKPKIIVTQTEIENYRSRLGSLTGQITGIKNQYEPQIQEARDSGNEELVTFFTKEMNSKIADITADYTSDDAVKSKIVKEKEQEIDEYVQELERFRSNYTSFQASFVYRLVETETGKVFTNVASSDGGSADTRLKSSGMRFLHTYRSLTASNQAVYTNSQVDQSAIDFKYGTYEGQIGVPKSAPENSPIMAEFHIYENKQITFLIYTGLGLLAFAGLIWMTRRYRTEKLFGSTALVAPYYNLIPLDLRAVLLLITGLTALVHLQWAQNALGYGFSLGDMIYHSLTYVLVNTLLVLLLVLQLGMLIKEYRNEQAFKEALRRTVIFWTYQRLREAALIKSLMFQALFVLAVAFGAGIGFVIVCIQNEAIVIYAILLMLFALPALWLTLKRISYFNRIATHTAQLVSGNLEQNLTVEGKSQLASLAANINLLRNGVKTSRREQAKSERLKTELITNVSHDLRTPLTSIITYTELLKNKELSEEDRQAFVDILDRKSQRLKVLIDDLFEASKIASGQVELAQERVDIVQLLEQALAEYNEAIKQSSLQLRVTTPDHPVSVWVDGQKLWRVFDNLIGNCVKYALEHTRVYIAVEAKPGRTVITFKNVTKYELSENIDELFERFKRGDASRHTEGSGLGLAIAKSIVDLHGGELDLDIDGDLFKVTVTLEERLE